MENKTKPEVGTRFVDKFHQVWIFAYTNYGAPIVINSETGGIGSWYDEQDLTQISLEVKEDTL